MPGQIFISYRRNDAAYVTGHINDRLCDAFGAESIFTDVDNIALGVDFRSVLDQKVGQCQILLAVIGGNWLTAKNQAGELRLRDPADFVRIEIESALKRNIPVIPLLIAGTTMPAKDELPESLQDLSFRNGTQIRPVPDFHVDIDRLIISLKKHLQSVSRAAIEVDNDQPVAETERKGEQQQEPFLADSNADRGHQNNQSDFSETSVVPEYDERARKQIELNRDHMKGRKAAFVFRPPFVAFVLTVAAASWYIDFEYKNQFETALAALTELRGPAGDDEPELAADAAAQARSAVDAIATVHPEAAGFAAAESEAEADVVDNAPGNEEPIAATNGAPATNAESEPIIDETTKGDGDAELNADANESVSSENNSEADAVAEVQDEADAIAQSEADAEAQLRLDASAAFREGISLAALGDHEAAILNYSQAIPIIAEPAFVYKQRGASYHALGDYEAAVRDFGEAIQLNAEDANAFYSRGAANHELGKLSIAVQDYDEAIRLNPQFAGAFQRRSASHEAAGNHEAAERDLAAAAEIRSIRMDGN